ncbi:hypothetical protein JCM14124_04380 [Humidesulfovibrio idahonensis]
MDPRQILCDWVVAALNDLGGSAHIIPICKHIWNHHEHELRDSGDLFYTWQYDVRWAGQKLRDTGVLAPVYNQRGLPWTLL